MARVPVITMTVRMYRILFAMAAAVILVVGGALLDAADVHNFLFNLVAIVVVFYGAMLLADRTSRRRG